MVEVSANHSILCNEKLFVPHVDKSKPVTWIFTVKSSVSYCSCLSVQVIGHCKYLAEVKIILVLLIYSSPSCRSR